MNILPYFLMLLGIGLFVLMILTLSSVVKIGKPEDKNGTVFGMLFFFIGIISLMAGFIQYRRVNA